MEVETIKRDNDGKEILLECKTTAMAAELQGILTTRIEMPIFIPPILVIQVDP